MSAISDLIATLSAEGCPATAFYDYLAGVTLSGGKVASVAGQVGTEPTLTGAGSPLPSIDTSPTGGITTDGVQNYLSTATNAAFNQNRANWLVYIGTCSGATGGSPLAISNAGASSYFQIIGARTGFVGMLSGDGEIYSAIPKDNVVRCYVAWWSTIDPTSGFSNIGIEVMGKLRKTGSPNDGGYLATDSYLMEFGAPFYAGAYNADTMRTIIAGTGDLTRNATLAIQNFAQQQRGAKLESARNALITIGDSLTFGYPLDEATQAWPAIAMQDPMLANYYDLHNLGITNLTEASMYSIAPVRADPSINPARSRTIVTVWAGTNDINYNGVNDVGLAGSFAKLCAERRALGAKVIAVTMIKRGTFNATQEGYRQNFNAWLMANWQNFADAVADVASNPNFSNTANTTYYQADTTHLTAAGYVSVSNDPTYGILPVIKSLDWSVAPGLPRNSSATLSAARRIAPTLRAG